MTEIWNLSSICRCCHADGELKALDQSYFHSGNVVVYSQLIYDTFGLMISPPPCTASHGICEECAQEVAHAAAFKARVVNCEKHFQEYCNNEFQSLSVKSEVPSDASDSETAATPSHHNYNDLDEKPDLPEHTEILLTKSEVSDARIEITIGDIKEEGNTKERDEPRQNEKDSTEVTSTKNVRCCKICSITFKNSTLLNSHMRIEHLKFRCSHCSLLFSNIKKKQLHIKEKHYYKCVDCSKHFTSEQSLERHYTLQHSRNPNEKESIFQCNYCNKIFTKKYFLIRHIQMHLGLQKKFCCETCGHRFNDVTNLNKHVSTVHLKVRAFACTKCPKTYAQKKTLVAHERICMNTQPYNCKICSKSFTYLNGRNKHYLNTHKELISDVTNVDLKCRKTDVFTCSQCKEVFPTNGKLRIHFKTHAGSLPLKCPFCPRDFNIKYSLNRHMETHKEHTTSKFSCEICHKIFANKTSVYRHKINIHNPKAESLATKCTICNKMVKNMAKHKAAHLERPHKCQHCNKTYPQGNALNRHIRIVHLGHKFTCEECGKMFTKRWFLDRHKRKAHQ